MRVAQKKNEIDKRLKNLEELIQKSKDRTDFLSRFRFQPRQQVVIQDDTDLLSRFRLQPKQQMVDQEK